MLTSIIKINSNLTTLSDMTKPLLLIVSMIVV